MSRKVRFGVIGSCGLIGNHHVNVLGEGQGAYELTALCDIDQPRLAEQMDKLHLPGTTSVDELVKRHDVDAVIVATPHPLHAQHVIQVVEAKKDVICEKPLAACPTDARRLLKAVRANRRVAGIHYQGRGRPAIVKLKQMIDAGELGRLLSLRLTGSYYKTNYYYSLGGWRGTWKDEGGGVLINQAPHDIDTLCYLAGGHSPAQLQARWTNQYHANSQVEDIASAIGVFPNGVEFAMQVSVSLHGDSSRFEVFGSKGVVVFQGDKIARFAKYDNDLVEFCETYPGTNPYQGPAVAEQALPSESGNDKAAVHKAFAEAVLTRDRSKLLVSAEQGLGSAEMIYAIYLAGYLGKTVKLPVSALRYDKMLADLVATGRHVERVTRQTASGQSAF